MEVDVANAIQDGGEEIQNGGTTTSTTTTPILSKSQIDFFENCKYDAEKKDTHRSNEQLSAKAKVDQCSSSSCTVASDEVRKINCGSCYRPVHWGCTMLPAYQLQQFINLGDSNGYICISCTKVDELTLQACADTTEATLQKRCEDQAKLIASLKEELNKYTAKLIIGATEKRANSKKKRKRDSESIQHVQLSSVEEEEETDNEPSIDSNTPADRILSGMERLLNKRFTEIEDKVVNLVEKKLAERDPSFGTGKSTYASVATISNDEAHSNRAAELKSIIRSSKNEDLVEEKDRKNRSKNIIIHGKPEEETDSVSNDQTFVSKFLKDICVGNLKPRSISRLGAKNPFRLRPIKLVFELESEKDKVLQNLSNLKNQNEYNRISVTADYTQSERELIKSHANEAKIRNENEPEDSGYVWKLRGTPKNGLFIRRVTKVNPVQN